MRPEPVVFDIGNVLLHWDPEGYYDQQIGSEARRRMFDETDILAVNLAIDAGAPYRETIYDLADRHPDWAGMIRLWHDDQFGMLQPVIEASVRLLRALRARGVPVFALTNFGRESFAAACRHYQFLTEFDRHYVSGRLGVNKPDPRIYEILERDSGIAPGRLIFTDDRPENIEVAEARGWLAPGFDGPEGWAARLVDEGLLTETEAGL